MANSDYQILPDPGPFAPVMELDEDVDYLDEWVKVRAFDEPYEKALVRGMTVLLGDELTVLLDFTYSTNPEDPLGPEVATRLRLMRGCSDTVPEKHSTGDTVWVVDTFLGDVTKQYAAGDEVSVKVLPFLPGGQRLPIEKESPEHLVFNWRFFRPYPPARMRANGARWWVAQQLNADNPVVSLTWVSRNRLEQFDQLIGHDEAEIAGEIGQTYTCRVYDHTDTLVRTEVGLTTRVYNYTWAQAIADFGVGTSVEGEDFEGHLEFESSRDGFASWTHYVLPLVLNNKNVFMFAALTSEQTAQRSIEADLPQTINVAQIAEQTATGDALPSQHTLMAAQIAETAGQLTSFYTPIIRYLVEAPYLHLLRRGLETSTNRVLTTAARPSDRLTDTHMVYGRGNTTSEFAKRDDPPWTPWLRIDENMDPLQQVVSYSETSLTDGVAIPEVVGRMAYLAGEIVRVEAINATHVTLARGCADTVPAFQKKTARLWFFDNGAGLDGPVTTYNDGTKVEDKIVPGVYGPPLQLSQVPTDVITIASRTPRPYPPGYVKLNGQPWYLGWRAAPGTALLITWNQRNRLTQGTSIIDHNAPNIPHEVGTRYRLLLEIVLRGEGGQSSKVKIREMFSDTLSFEYTYDMARTDGMRAGQLLKACGQVTVPAYLDAIRDGRINWQGYAFPLTLPSYACPINQPPGGGQGPIGGGGGGGQGPGNGGGGGGTGGGGGEGGSGGDGGDPPVDPNPPTWPEIPPEQPGPDDPGEPDPEDTDPDPDDNGEHWDYRWDIHWDAYRRRPGNNQGEG